MIPVLLILAAMYWLAAPDPVTAGARTAAGTGARAAGRGVGRHWADGRDTRRGRRTNRRERWGGHVKGATRHPWLLRIDRALTWMWGATKTTAGVAGAAARPVPMAIRDGYAKGQDRHRARAGDRPGGLALDPPWWRPKPKPEQVADVPEHPAGTGPEQVPGQPGGQVPEQVTGTGPEQVEDTPLTRTPFFDDSLDPEGPTLDSEDEIRARHPDLTWISPAPLTTANRRFWTLRDRGYPGAIDQDGWPAPDFHTGVLVNPMPYLDRPVRPSDATPEPLKVGPDGPDTDPGAGNSPTSSPTTPTEGNDMAIRDYSGEVKDMVDARKRGEGRSSGSNVPSVELNDLDSLRRFAEYISSLGEDSEFMQIVERCKSLRESLREGGFGGHVDQAGASFEETAAALGQLGTEFCEEAGQMAQLAANVAGG